MIRRVAILGSTGSIGCQTLDVVRENRDEFEIVGLASGGNVELLTQQIREFEPRYFSSLADVGPEIHGATRLSVEELVRRDEVEFVMHAMSGTSGLAAAATALAVGKTVGLANKESVVMAGGLLVELAAQHGGRLLPIDSEPSAIWQCIVGEEVGPAKYYITASGGAFRDRPWSELGEVTPAEALCHPNWTMGPKITVDCATMMNKAFEVVETSVMFGADLEDVGVVLHRESVVHAMVEMPDGSIKAHIGAPDMRQPIQFALFHPDRRARAGVTPLKPTGLGQLTFEPLEAGRYPCFDLAMDYIRQGGSYNAVLAGADDAAVDLFLAARIGFTDILRVVGTVLERHRPHDELTIARAIEDSQWAAREACAVAAGR